MNAVAVTGDKCVNSLRKGENAMGHIGFRWGKVCSVGGLFLLLACEEQPSAFDNVTYWDSDANTEEEVGFDDAAEKWATRGSHHVVLAPDADTLDLREASVDLFIPINVARVRGVLLFASAGVGEAEFDNAVWRTSAAINGYGLVRVGFRDAPGKPQLWDVPRQMAIMVSRALNVLATKSGHHELSDCPIIFWGHSAGGFWQMRAMPHLAARTAGFVAFHGSLTSHALYSPDVLQIPGLFLIGDADLIWIREAAVDIVRAGRPFGARWALVVEPEVGHSDVTPGRWLMTMFVEKVFERRVVISDDAPDERLPLATLPESDGWLGQLAHRSVFGGDEMYEDAGKEVIENAAIAPWDSDTSLPERSNWLITEGFAKAWLAYEQLGVHGSDGSVI